jgi:hypothetical protein
MIVSAARVEDAKIASNKRMQAAPFLRGMRGIRFVNRSGKTAENQAKQPVQTEPREHLLRCGFA